MIHCGDALKVLGTLPSESVHCCVTSPPYWSLRDYGVDGQIGLETAPSEYVDRLVEIFGEVRRVLRDDGTLWLNLGDSFAAGKIGRSDHGSESPTIGLAGNTAGAVSPGPVTPRKAPTGLKPKDLVGIPWRVAFALQEDSWHLRSDIIWHKPNPMPESVRDRPTKAHEYLFLLSKSSRYAYDAEAIREAGTGRSSGKVNDDVCLAHDPSRHRTRNGFAKVGDVEWQRRNKRSVWTVATQPYGEAHFATFPPKLIEPCIKAGCPEGGTVLDPFFGAGTTGLVASRLGREYIGIELNPEYCEMARRRIRDDAPLLNDPRVLVHEDTAGDLV